MLDDFTAMILADYSIISRLDFRGGERVGERVVSESVSELMCVCEGEREYVG